MGRVYEHMTGETQLTSTRAAGIGNSSRALEMISIVSWVAVILCVFGLCVLKSFVRTYKSGKMAFAFCRVTWGPEFNP